MLQQNKIDYSKFKCEVYSPDGALLQEARINALNDFYCSGLVPGQQYNLVFSYDDILIECLAFNCDNTGKVVYLSPAHIVFNKDVEIPPLTFINGVKSKIKKSIDYNVPPMFWAKRALDAFIHSTHDSVKKRKIKTRHALDAFIESTHEGAKRFAHQHPVYFFKAGAELANKVK